MIIWLVGLSGAGKTTIASEMYKQWKLRDSGTVLVDGDQVREIFQHDKSFESYSVAGRRINAERIVQLSCWLDQQSINVVASILCIFPDILLKNRTRFSSYIEVFVDVPMDQLVARDSKGLYAPALEGKIENVVGIDIPFPRPESPDIVLDNSNQHNDPKGHANYILKHTGIF